MKLTRFQLFLLFRMVVYLYAKCCMDICFFGAFSYMA